MSDTTQVLQLPGAQLESIEQNGDTVKLGFSLVHLVQEMEGAIEDSLWTQAIKLTVTGAEISGELPDCPCEIAGGDLVNNIFTYRDHAPLPIDWHGETRCMLHVSGNNSFTIEGDSIQVEQIDLPRYIKHVRK
ncbi:MAG TPA: hypothetical protein VLB10_06020 [Gammaproteobacteria bacterium]|jgi:hypothetical protein|nr:hypothetical protein [Gammaproteobacteria bacterium]